MAAHGIIAPLAASARGTVTEVVSPSDERSKASVEPQPSRDRPHESTDVEEHRESVPSKSTIIMKRQHPILIVLHLLALFALPITADDTPAVAQEVVEAEVPQTTATAPETATAETATAETGNAGTVAADPGNATDPVWLTSVTEAVDAARSADRYILVDLYAEWCGWCHTLEEKVFTHPNFIAYVRDNNFVLLRVDTEDKAEGTWLKARFGANSLPTTLILDADLVKVGAVSGFAPMPTFVEYLQEQIDGYDTILSFFDKVLASDDAELQRKLASDLHLRGDGVRAGQLYEKILDRVQHGTEAEAWLTYQAADAYRMGRSFDIASRHLSTANDLAQDLDHVELLERIALLDVHVAQEIGDCDRVLSTLEHFLAQYPKSIHSRDAQRTLKAIQNGEALECT